ncbi:MAG: glycoside hydrolase family 127 protein, partial [Ferruginibacter sp.]|nr:glycoside hydrolase family 127 protein [Ferruginibacter sp.]
QANLNLMIRIPGWAQDEAIPSNLYTFATASVAKPTLLLNGKAVAYEMVKGYASIRRSWKKGDVVTVQLPMDVRRVVANENVKDDLGKIALQRGPLVYCAEWVDNFGKASNLILPKDLSFTTEFKPGLLNGVTVIQSTIPSIVIKDAARVETQQAIFTAIPYYSWANRGKGEMQVWFPQQLKDINLIAH